MRAVPGQRERVLAVVRALKMAGIRVRNWKSFIQSPEQAEESLQSFAFGRDLQSLPQHHLTDLDGTVPLLLVEACNYLSQHLHTEGLFRKTGSLSRIRALRADLEQGERVFCPPHDALLQPCDVASLLKQFLRELPQPLIPADLQGALCQAQALEMELGPEKARDRATLLITTLLPPAQARTLKYLCTFLSQVAHRCDENKMEVGNLALVMAPNLLQCPTQPCKLTIHTEKQLDQQTAVIKALILYADQIGVLPSFILDSLGSVEDSESTPPADGAVFTKRTGLSVYRSLRRQRRRSVGEMFVDVFSRLKPARTPTCPPITLDSPIEGQLLFTSPNPQSPITVKRKASEETAAEGDGSAKKRRSLHDLRVDSQSISSHSADESTGSQSPPAMKNNKEDLHPNVTKRRSHIRGQRKTYRPPKQDEAIAHCRRRSLRFFTLSSSSNDSPALSRTASDDPEPCLSACKTLSDDKPFNSDTETSLKIPFIVIDAPGTVIIGSEVDDDPDLLNCSFVDSPHDSEPLPDQQRRDHEEPDDDDHWVLLEDGDTEVVVEYKVTQTSDQTEAVNESPKAEPAQVPEEAKPPPFEPKPPKRNSKKGSRPRRSISMPEVALDPCSDEIEVHKQGSPKHSATDDDFWSASVNLLDDLSTSGGKKTGGKDTDGRENSLRRKYGSFLDRRKDKLPDSDPGIKRTQHRLSVADRLRNFSALAAFLRTPRTVVPQLGHQRGTARLRRQGARRFSRSFSHEGVPERVPGESLESPQEEQQAFVELTDAYADDPGDPQVLDIEVSPNKTSSVEDLTLVGSPQRSDETLHLQMEKPELLAQPYLVINQESDCDLHNLLQRQCHVADDDQDFGVFSQSTPGEAQLDIHYNRSSVSPLCHQQGSPNSSIDLQSFSASSTHSPQCSSFAERYIGSHSTPPYEASPCKDLPCLSFSDYISISSSMREKCSHSLDLSPPAFQFRPQASRRHYKDSPRWPSNEVRMTTWKPLPL